jgi:peptide/nickel transport system substrate-binding protein
MQRPTSFDLLRLAAPAIVGAAALAMVAARPTEPAAALQVAPGSATSVDPLSLAFTDAAKRSLRGGSNEPSRDGGTMVVAVSSQYDTLNNVTRASGASDTFCRAFLYPPLLDLDVDTLEPVPLLAAARPTVSEDHLHYTWKLRPGVLWHRRSPDDPKVEVTTDDVLFSWRMIQDPKVEANRARAGLDFVADVAAVDRTTFVVTTKKPYFRAEFGFGYDFRLMPAHLASHDPAKFAKDPLGRAPVGYGPYQLVEWKEGQYLSLARNPDWFAADRLPYHPAALRVHFADLPQMAPMFERGDLSFTVVNDYAQYEAMKADAKLRERATFHEYYLTAWNYLVWNLDRPLFADVRVRRALTMLYPREQVKAKSYLDHAAVVTGPWPVSVAECDRSVVPLPFDVAGAAKLLAEAGFADHDGDGLLDKDGVPFRFTLEHARTLTPPLATGNLWFQQHLREVGIAVDFLPTDNNKLFDDLSKHAFDAAQAGWTADPRDEDVFDRFASSAIATGTNYGNYRDAECDRLLEAYRAEFDPGRRLEIAHAIHRKLAADQPMTFLFNPQSLVVVSSKLRNVKMHRLGARWFDWWIGE